MNKDREPKPNRFSIESVTQTAKEILLQNGVHSPMIIVEGSDLSLVGEFDQMADTYEGRTQQLFFTGVNMAQSGEVGTLQQVFFISEAWMSLAQEGQLPDVPPSEDPNRKEVLIISGIYIPAQEMKLVICQMVRDDQGQLTEIRDFNRDEETQQKVESPLLNAFVAGYSKAYDQPTFQ